VGAGFLGATVGIGYAFGPDGQAGAHVFVLTKEQAYVTGSFDVGAAYLA
jgi:hypothetical protein